MRLRGQYFWTAVTVNRSCFNCAGSHLLRVLLWLHWNIVTESWWQQICLVWIACSCRPSQGICTYYILLRCRFIRFIGTIPRCRKIISRRRLHCCRCIGRPFRLSIPAAPFGLTHVIRSKRHKEERVPMRVCFRIQEHCHDDGHVLGTPHIYEYLWRVMYNRRSKFNPLWNALVVGGVHKGEK